MSESLGVDSETVEQVRATIEEKDPSVFHARNIGFYLDDLKNSTVGKALSVLESEGYLETWDESRRYTSYVRADSPLAGGEDP